MKLLILFWLCLMPFSLWGQNDETQRKAMVQHQLQKRDIRNEAVLSAMEKVPRHVFVPENLRKNAYEDRPLPIGYGQTISQPYIVAYMTQVIDPKPDDRVLEIGTGSGYQAAVLSVLVDSVFTIEIIQGLAKESRATLQKYGFSNVVVKHGDGYYGLEKKAPFDAIVVTAAAEHIPPPLIQQLKDGGKMIIPVGSPFLIQTLMLVEKKGESIQTTSLFPVRFVPLTRDVR